MILSTSFMFGHQLLSFILGGGYDKEIQKYVNMRRQDDRSALHLAAQMGHTEMMKILYYKGAHTDQGSAATTPLHLASEGGHCDSVRLLLSFGIPIHARDKDGQTALHE